MIPYQRPSQYARPRVGWVKRRLVALGLVARVRTASDRRASNPDVTIAHPELLVLRILADAVARDLDRAGVHGLISIRDRALTLASGLASVRDLEGDIKRLRTRWWDLDRAGIRDRSLDLAFARIRALDLARVRALNVAHASNSASDLALARTHDSALARTYDSALAQARASAHEVTRALDAIKIDVSGADLSHLNNLHLDLLINVIWTPRTTWPADIAEQVRARSREIRPGVFQVTTREIRPGVLQVIE